MRHPALPPDDLAAFLALGDQALVLVADHDRERHRREQHGEGASATP